MPSGCRQPGALASAEGQQATSSRAVGWGCWGSSPGSAIPADPDPVTSTSSGCHGVAGGTAAPGPLPQRSLAWQAPTRAEPPAWVTGTGGGQLGRCPAPCAVPAGAAGTMCFQSPCPQPRCNPNHLRPLACNPSAPGYRINGSHAAPRRGSATACHGTASRDGQLPLPGANPCLVLPAAPAHAGWFPSCPPPTPGNTIGTCIPSKNSPFLRQVPVVAHGLVPSHQRWGGGLSGPQGEMALAAPRWGDVTGMPRLAPGWEPGGVQGPGEPRFLPMVPGSAGASPHRSPSPASPRALSGEGQGPPPQPTHLRPPKSMGAQSAAAQQTGKGMGCERGEIIR